MGILVAPPGGSLDWYLIQRHEVAMTGPHHPRIPAGRMPPDRCARGLRLRANFGNVPAKIAIIRQPTWGGWAAATYPNRCPLTRPASPPAERRRRAAPPSRG